MQLPFAVYLVMSTVTAPLRIDLAGGMTDLPVFSRDIGTSIVNLAIDVPDPLPIGTGLGASSRASVCKIAAEGKVMNRGQIVVDAYNYEVNELGIEGGFQDFIAAAFGGLNYINFDSPDITNLTGNPNLGIKLDPKLKNYFDSHMVILLVRTNQKSSAAVAQDQIQRYKENPDEYRPILLSIKKCNQEMFRLLTSSGSLAEIGRVMNESTKLQKELSPLVGSGVLADWQKRAEPFCYGIRTPGAGANSLFLLVKPDQMDQVISEFTKDDTQILRAKVNEIGCSKLTFPHPHAL
jgi:D-glycero-alpha-D-manno-heptose-7-phosphate kinase